MNIAFLLLIIFTISVSLLFWAIIINDDDNKKDSNIQGEIGAKIDKLKNK
jgi:hypothetical protein